MADSVKVLRHGVIATCRGYLEGVPRLSRVNGQEVANAQMVCGPDRMSVSAWSSRAQASRAQAFARLAPGEVIEVQAGLEQQEGSQGGLFWNLRVFAWQTGASGGAATFHATGRFVSLSYNGDGSQAFLNLESDENDRVRPWQVSIGPALDAALAGGGIAAGDAVRVAGYLVHRVLRDVYGRPEGVQHALSGQVLDVWRAAPETGEMIWIQVAAEKGA